MYAHFSRDLQNRTLSILETLCAEPMRRFGAAYLWFQHISNRAPSDGLEIVILFLSIPCFKLSNLFFKITYTLQYRQLVRLGRDCASQGGTDFSLYFKDFGSD
jgi:hypothetical protein